MSEWPTGYAARARGGSVLVAVEERIRALIEAGFDEPESWEKQLADAGRPGTSGRGCSAAVEIDGTLLRVKRMRRGGMVGQLWRDRFVGTRRLRQNLVVPVEAARRGVATPMPVALLIVPGPRGLHRAWLATQEIAGTIDLLGACKAQGGVDRERLAAALAAVRHMHDCGVEHRDLNLGNLLVSEGGAARAWIIDLDLGRLHDRPLGLRLRRLALERLERSWAKSALDGAMPPARATLDELYAAANRDLALRLARGRRVNRYRIALHRLGWRR